MSLLHPLNMSTHVAGTCFSPDHSFKLKILHNLHTPLNLKEFTCTLTCFDSRQSVQTPQLVKCRCLHGTKLVITVWVKVKQSCYRPGVAQIVPRS